MSVVPKISSPSEQHVKYSRDSPTGNASKTSEGWTHLDRGDVLSFDCQVKLTLATCEGGSTKKAECVHLPTLNIFLLRSLILILSLAERRRYPLFVDSNALAFHLACIGHMPSLWQVVHCWPTWTCRIHGWAWSQPIHCAKRWSCLGVGGITELEDAKERNVDLGYLNIRASKKMLNYELLKRSARTRQRRVSFSMAFRTCY